MAEGGLHLISQKRSWSHIKCSTAGEAQRSSFQAFAQKRDVPLAALAFLKFKLNLEKNKKRS